jgi:hypothetical protein
MEPEEDRRKAEVDAGRVVYGSTFLRSETPDARRQTPDVVNAGW